MKSYLEEQEVKIINQQGLDKFIEEFIKTNQNNKWWKGFIKYYDNNARHVSFESFDDKETHRHWEKDLCQFLREAARYLEGIVDFSCDDGTKFTIIFKNKRVSVEYVPDTKRTMTPEVIDMIAEGEL